jgi:hypothetical protein
VKNIYTVVLIIASIALSGCFENHSKKSENITNIISNKVTTEDLQPNKVSNTLNNKMYIENTKIITSSVVKNSYYIFGNIGQSIIIAKLSLDNKFIWMKKYSSLNKLELLGITKDKGFIIKGQEFVPSYKNNAFVMKIDYDGNIIWDKTFGTESTSTGLIKMINTDNGYLAFGRHNSNLLILKIDKDGTKTWEKEIQFSSNDIYYYYALKNQTEYTVYLAPFNPKSKEKVKKVSIDVKGNFTKEDIVKVPVEVKKEHDVNSFYNKVINQNLYNFVNDKEYYIVQKSIGSKVDWEYKIKKEDVQSTLSGIKVLETKDLGCIVLHVFLEAPHKLATDIIKLNKQGVKVWVKHFENSNITNGKEITENQFVFIGNNYNVNTKVDANSNAVKYFVSNKKAILIFLNQTNI